MRLRSAGPRLLAAGAACLLCLAPAAPASADQSAAVDQSPAAISLQGPAYYSVAEPYHLDVTLGQLPAAPADVVYVFHASTPGLTAFTGNQVLEPSTVVTDASGTTVTVRLHVPYGTTLTAGQVLDRQIDLREPLGTYVPVTMTAELVDHASGQVEASSAPVTAPIVDVSDATTWQSTAGTGNGFTSAMPIVQTTTPNSYMLDVDPAVSPGLVGARAVVTVSAAQLRAAGYTAAQVAAGLEPGAGVGTDNLVPAAAWTANPDGSLSLALPPQDFAPATIGSGAQPNYYWQLTLDADCTLPPATLDADIAVTAGNGQVLTDRQQAFTIRRGECLTHDFTGDGRPDLLARDRAGVLWLFPGTGRAAAPYGHRIRVGGGWMVYTSLVASGDLSKDGHDDLIARDRTGHLWLYQGTGNASAPFRPRVPASVPVVGTTNRLAANGPLEGDGLADVVDYGGNPTVFLIGTGKASSPFSAAGGTAEPLRGYSTVTGAGRLARQQWFAARDGSGVLWLVPDLYRWEENTTKRVRVGGGWQIYNTVVQSGDASSSGHDGLVARDGAGRLWLYTGTGEVGVPYLPRVLVGGGWQSYDLLV